MSHFQAQMHYQNTKISLQYFEHPNIQSGFYTNAYNQ